MGLEYVVIIYAAGLILLITEVFVPGGLLGIAGAIGLSISIYYGFIDYGLWFGSIQFILTLIILPFGFFFALKRLKLSKELKNDDGFVSSKEGLDELIGKEGISYTYLRPAGTVVIDGKKIDVVTEGGMIEKDKPVKIIKVEGSRIVVRAK